MKNKSNKIINYEGFGFVIASKVKVHDEIIPHV
jgi:hypothetical protein